MKKKTIKKEVKTYRFELGVPKRYVLSVECRKPATKEIKLDLLTVSEKLDKLTEWKLPNNKTK